MAVLKAGLSTERDTLFANQVYHLFETGIYHAMVLDYAVSHITNENIPGPQGIFGNNAATFTYQSGRSTSSILSKVEVQRKGDWVSLWSSWLPLKMELPGLYIGRAKKD
jgi:hypothetical protein